jgi:hypothetical protein
MNAVLFQHRLDEIKYVFAVAEARLNHSELTRMLGHVRHLAGGCEAPPITCSLIKLIWLITDAGNVNTLSVGMMVARRAR